MIDFDNHSGYNHKFDNDELVIELNKMKAHLNTALKNSRIKIYFAKGLEFDIKYNKPVVIDEEINENKDVNKKAIRKNYESDYFDPIEEAMDRVTREEDQGDLFSEW